MPYYSINNSYHSNMHLILFSSLSDHYDNKQAQKKQIFRIGNFGKKSYICRLKKTV